MDERRTGYLLIALLLGQLVMVAIQGARSTRSRTYAEVAGMRLLGPAARLVTATTGGAAELGHKVELQGQLIDENRRLRREVEELRLRMLRLADVEQEQPVLSPAGLVGRVVLVSGPYAKVQLITDGAAAVGGMILRTRRQGVVRGGGREGGGLSFDYVPATADVRPGDVILTAGIDGVYPRGITVGTVVAVESGGQLFRKIRLAPAADFGALDQVYLLEHAPLPQELAKAIPGARR